LFGDEQVVVCDEHEKFFWLRVMVVLEGPFEGFEIGAIDGVEPAPQFVAGVDVCRDLVRDDVEFDDDRIA
jgi:hypothetical protein